MHNLSPITALGGSAPRIDQVADLVCTEVTDLALASVAARLTRENACSEALTKLLNVRPPEAGKVMFSKPFSAFWIGPDQWVIGADFDKYEDLASHIKAELKDTASVTEQTDSWCGFDLKGASVQAVMELLSNINIRAMSSGDSTRTSIHHLGCFVLCENPQSAIRILGPRASAGSLHHAIITAMKSAL